MLFYIGYSEKDSRITFEQTPEIWEHNKCIPGRRTFQAESKATVSTCLVSSMNCKKIRVTVVVGDEVGEEGFSLSNPHKSW